MFAIETYEDDQNVTASLSSGAAPEYVLGGLWALDGEALESTEGGIFYFRLVGELNTDEAAMGLAAMVQRLSPAHCAPIYDIDLLLNVYGAAVCGSGYCSAT
jgi:hypothetical protein